MVVDQLPANISVLLGQDVAIVANLQINCRDKVVKIGYENETPGIKSQEDDEPETSSPVEEEETDSFPSSWDETDSSDDEIDEDLNNLIINSAIEVKYNLDEGLNEEEKDKITEKLKAHRDVFSFPGDPLGCTHLGQHEKNTGDSPPIHQHPYRLSPPKRDLATKMAHSKSLCPNCLMR